jgi:hypothetical protein
MNAPEGATGHAVTRRPGDVVAAIGGLLTLLAYLVLPVATIPLLGSVSAPDLTEGTSDAGSLALLRIVPIAAVVTIAIGLWLWLGKAARRARAVGAIVILVCAVLTALAYLIPYARLQGAISDIGASSLGISATTFTGIGFWCGLLGAVVSGIGAAVQLSGRARRG